MIRFILPVTLACLALPAAAETIHLAPDPTTGEEDCTARAFDHRSCVRVLACVGDDGDWLEGRAYGWDDGTVAGRTRDGVTCEGTWRTRNSIGSTHLTCSDGTEIDVIYANQDNATGTGLGRGMDSQGRTVRSWSGAHVLQFLTPAGKLAPELSCGGRSWALS